MRWFNRTLRWTGLKFHSCLTGLSEFVACSTFHGDCPTEWHTDTAKSNASQWSFKKCLQLCDMVCIHWLVISVKTKSVAPCFSKNSFISTLLFFPIRRKSNYNIRLTTHLFFWKKVGSDFTTICSWKVATKIPEIQRCRKHLTLFNKQAVLGRVCLSLWPQLLLSSY